MDALIEPGATSYVLGSPDWIVNGVGGSVAAIEQARLTTASTASLIDASSFAGVTALSGGAGDDTLSGGLPASIPISATREPPHATRPAERAPKSATRASRTSGPPIGLDAD